jgi:hypothetical protein
VTKAIELLYFEGCPHSTIAEERLRTALYRLGRADTPVVKVAVEDPDHAERLGFTGSPTVRVDGHDPFATGTETVAFACRVYATPHGYSGSPTVQQFMDVLA